MNSAQRLSPAQRQFEERILDHLETLWRIRGTPQSLLAEALGVTRGQVTQRFKGKVRLAASELAMLLETLEVAPDEFFAGVAGGFHAELYLARLEQKAPREVKYAKNDLLREPPAVPLEAGELLEIAGDLQELRLADARAAWKQAVEVLRTLAHSDTTVDPRVECETRIALGAISRARGKYSRAAYFLREALRFAAGDSGLKSRALLAVTSLAGDQGDFQVAQDAVETAVVEAARAGNVAAQGRALVSRGVLWVNQGDFQAALACYERSLLFLAGDRWYLRFAAHQGIGLCQVHLDRLDEAMRHADLALAAGGERHLAPMQKAAALWLRGEIFLKTGYLEAGAQDLATVLRLFIAEKTSTLDLALISLRLASVYKLLGDLIGIRELTALILPVIRNEVPKNELLTGAFSEFLSVAQRDELSTKVIRSTYQKVLNFSRGAPPAAYLAVS